MTSVRRRLAVATALTAAAGLLTVGTAGSALAASPGGGGQPSKTCLDPGATMEPGHAADARGSAFNENGGIAGGMYAGSQPQNSNNPKSVSQYDVACFEVTQNR